MSATVGHTAGDALDHPHVVAHDAVYSTGKAASESWSTAPLSFGVVA